MLLKLDFGIFNIDFSRKGGGELISVVAIEIKVSNNGFTKEKFKEIIKKVEKERKWNPECDCYLLFFS